MSTVRRRRLAATALATTALLTLGGCGTGFSADTNRVYQAAVGADYRGEISALNTLFVTNDDGSATLSTSIVNNTDTDEELSSITATTLDGKELEVRSTEVALKRGVLTIIGGTDAAGGFWVTGGASAGDYVRVTLTFSQAAPVTIEAPVVARTAEYDSVAGAPAPEPTPKPTDAEATADPTE